MRREEPLIAPRDSIALMEGYHSPQLDVQVRLNTNEAPEAPPTEFIERVRSEITEILLNRYPDRLATELREAIGAFHGLAPDRVFPANGSNEVLQCLMLAYGGPGRSVLVFEPTYALHTHIPRVIGTSVLSGRRDEHYLVTPDEVKRALDEAARLDPEGPAVVMLCSPNNPTGRIESEEVIEAVLDRAPGLVVVDEAYGDFAEHSALELIDQHRNLVVVRTFSKTWSMAALRLGYAIADPEVVDALFKVALPYHLDSVKQIAGRIALDYVDDMRDRVRRLVEERERLLRALRALPLEVCPSQANFILFRVPDRDSTAVWQAMIDRSVIVRVPSSDDLAGFLRVTVGTPEENDAFLAALEGAIAAH